MPYAGWLEELIRHLLAPWQGHQQKARGSAAQIGSTEPHPPV